MGLSTIFGLRRLGYFIPYRYLDRQPSPPAVYPAIEEWMAASEPTFIALLEALSLQAEALAGIGEDAPAPRPRWGQDWFEPLDAAIAYTIVATRKPRRIIEIGSGHSTRFMTAAIRDGGLDSRFDSVDPAPRAALLDLPVTWHRATLQDVDPSIFESLGPNDVLFIDSSHIAMPGSDVDRLLLDVIPRVSPGGWIHVHDIFLPDGYPADWQWRGYNEQTAFGALLVGGGFDLCFASHYVATRMRSRLEALPMGERWLTGRPSSLWLRKKA